MRPELGQWMTPDWMAEELVGAYFGDLAQLYREIEGSQPTSNRFWQAKVRQQVQRLAIRVGPATWALRA